MKILLKLIILVTIFIGCSNNPSWKQLSTDGIESRTGSFAFTDSLKKLRVIGGSTPSADLNELWYFNFSTKTWNQSEEFMPDTFRKGERLQYSIYDEVDFTVYFAGTSGKQQAVPIDVYRWEIYTPPSNAWVKLNTEAGPSLKGHSVSLLREDSFFGEPVLVFFGGMTPSGTFTNELFIFRIISRVFEIIDIQSLIPDARMGHVGFISNEHKLFIWGGKTINGLKNDLWSFDFSTKSWEKLDSPPTMELQDRSSLFDNETNSIIVFGGKDKDNNPISEFGIYSITNKTWKSISLEDGLNARVGASIAFDENR
ncbi:hypothetical protein JXR93_08570, partial [bacterium]|nr:hypothetical protein [bacterium]